MNRNHDHFIESSLFFRYTIEINYLTFNSLVINCELMEIGYLDLMLIDVIIWIN